MRIEVTDAPRPEDETFVIEQTRAYNRRFTFCFQSWFDCIYRDKYH